MFNLRSESVEVDIDQTFRRSPIQNLLKFHRVIVQVDFEISHNNEVTVVFILHIELSIPDSTAVYTEMMATVVRLLKQGWFLSV